MGNAFSSSNSSSRSQSQSSLRTGLSTRSSSLAFDAEHPQDANRNPEIEPVQIDGGSTHPPQPSEALYKQPVDYNLKIVKQLILERKLSPFYKGVDEPEQVVDDETAKESASGTGLEELEQEGRRHEHETHQAAASPTYTECPICFLVYPNINYSLCCMQPICTECFVMIRRNESTMEPAECPYCCKPGFGVYYLKPGMDEAEHGEENSHQPKSNGTAYVQREDITSGHAQDITNGQSNDTKENSSPTPLSQEPTSLQAASSPAPEQPSESTQPPASLSISTENATVKDKTDVAPISPTERRKSLLKKYGSVVYSDTIRPDWEHRYQQLLLERAHQQRRTLQIQLNAQERLQRASPSATSGNGLQNSRGFQNEISGMRDLSDAATAAATIFEALSNLRNSTSQSTSMSRRRRERDRRRERANEHVILRHMGADLEEIMVMEAIRQSLLDAERNETSSTGGNGSPLSPGSTNEGASSTVADTDDDDDNVPLSAFTQSPGRLPNRTAESPGTA